MVLVGLGYLLWTWIGKGGGQVSESYCRAKLVTYCSGQAAKGKGDETIGGFFTADKNKDCLAFESSLKNEFTNCKQVIGIEE